MGIISHSPILVDTFKCSSSEEGKKNKMKFLLVVALIVCAYAEPEAEADAYYGGYYGLGAYGYAPRSYAYSSYAAPYAYRSYGYAPYRSYGAYRLHKRDAEAEPEADADAYYAGVYGAYRGYSAYPYSHGYSAYPYSYGYSGYASPYYSAYRGIYKRDAEAEPEADAYYAGHYGYRYPSYGYRSYGYGYPSYRSYGYGGRYAYGGYHY